MLGQASQDLGEQVVSRWMIARCLRVPASVVLSMG